ncbi:glycosyltransferase family 2 protein [Spiroplasma endosymbiont of Crioceris asparagi]|uniref:glycosyltransferase family 2 protein n=1 Tax=Spiroplasma endosymbiont of Crioceris asparagi TaxID=3066286 RepID=UPI0030CFF419
MVVSFICVTNLTKYDFNRTINSIKKQTSTNYEVIIIVDSFDGAQEEVSFNNVRKLMIENDNIKVIHALKPQGRSSSWNDSIKLAEGQYIKFINDGEELDPNFVERVEKIVAEKNAPDIIEYSLVMNLKTQPLPVDVLVKPNKVFDLTTDFNPLAYTGEIVFNKLFKLDIINEFTFRFNRKQRFDLLFVYKVFSEAKTYIWVEKGLASSYTIRPVDYSAFDTINQWTHIFNYFRRVGKYREVEHYIKYAYFRLLILKWLRTLKWEGNKNLIRKGVEFAKVKFRKEKREKFIKDNIILARKKDLDFNDWVENFESNIKQQILK